jgi:hypothetical protein
MPAPLMMGARGDTSNPSAETSGPPAVVRSSQQLRLVYLHAAPMPSSAPASLQVIQMAAAPAKYG